MKLILEKFNSLFPLWAMALSCFAFLNSELLTGFSQLIVPLLTLVMFCMGLTLKLEDFTRIVGDPRGVLVGVALQFVIMPLIAILLAKGLQLSTQLTVGMVLVGSCAGGTASNVICYLAKGDVALSISMTLASTLIGVIATPLLCAFYLSESIEVDVLAMLQSILQIVLLPVVAGTTINRFLGNWVQRVEFALPSISVVVILIIIAIIVALNSQSILEVGLLTLLAVILHNAAGLGGGYYVSRLLGLNIKQSQTIAIEVGMQNSGLAVALATQFFSTTAALPAAIFSVWHNISGSLLASHWSKKRSSLEYMIRDSS